jgi:PQQ-dependent catabolism-associated beta-propeller protein
MSEIGLMWLRLLLVLMSTALTGEAGAYTAYVSNERSNTVSVIDTNTWEVVKTIKVGQRPRGIAFTKDQKYVLVAVGDDDTIQMIDTGTNQVVGTLPSGPDPELFVEAPDGKTLYVANEDDNTVTIIDMANRTQTGDIQVGVEPEGMGISPDGKVLVNTSETTNMAHFIDTSSRKVVASVLVDARPRFAAFKQDGSELWVSSEVGGTVSVIDPVKHAVRQKIEFKITGMRPEPASWHWAPPITWRSSTASPTKSSSICWSGNASGTWRSRRTKNIFSRPTVCPTMFPSSTWRH